ncbi:MAG: prepilin-type N-terminal cleavage/methylation domain-containing protein [Candidatus Binatia bacterium]|nr:prepilin-type N-terminal cleavage/methylation domain-containing protein [Candidatus Binatia bacterium]
MDSPSRGFTLLELIISLTIFGGVAVIVYATLTLGARAAERGETRAVENQRARAALTLIARQLKSAYPLVVQAEAETFVYFEGRPDTLSFISAAGRPEAGGLEKVTYFLREHQGRRSLWVRISAPALPAEVLNGEEGGVTQEAEVFPHVERLAWEYFGTVRDRTAWYESWSGQEERKLPTAVRLFWHAPLGEFPSEWRMEIPLHVYEPLPELLSAPPGGAFLSRRRPLSRRAQ